MLLTAEPSLHTPPFYLIFFSCILFSPFFIRYFLHLQFKRYPESPQEGGGGRGGGARRAAGGAEGGEEDEDKEISATEQLCASSPLEVLFILGRGDRETSVLENTRHSGR